MFRCETSNILIILFTLFVKNMQIIALDLRFEDISYELKNKFKNHKHNVEQKDDFYPLQEELPKLNAYGIKRDLFEHQRPSKLKYSNEDSERNFVRKSNKIFGFEDPNYDYNYSDSSDQIKRREAPSGILHNTSLYPSVLTKALEISLNSSGPISTSGNLLRNVAHKMNTTALDLAKILTKTENTNTDDQFSKLIENYKRTKELRPTHSHNLPNQFKLQEGFEGSSQNVEEHDDSIAASNLAAILEHVLNKLELIQQMKENEDQSEEHPDGVPCDIVGSWSSTALGFCFDIQVIKDKHRYTPPAEINNNFLSVNVSECIPAKHHQIIDMEWKFTGSAMKLLGGPFYLYGQKKSERILSTFLGMCKPATYRKENLFKTQLFQGFCRTCNGIDTIFGSWNVLSPTKDCHDVSLGNEVRQDILRRVRMETKRKERFKNLLYQSRRGKL